MITIRSYSKFIIVLEAGYENIIKAVVVVIYWNVSKQTEMLYKRQKQRLY